MQVIESRTFSARILNESEFVVCASLGQRVLVLSPFDTQRNPKSSFKDAQTNTAVKVQRSDRLKLHVQVPPQFDIS